VPPPHPLDRENNPKGEADKRENAEEKRKSKDK
jgi:hypothetical protein